MQRFGMYAGPMSKQLPYKTGPAGCGQAVIPTTAVLKIRDEKGILSPGYHIMFIIIMKLMTCPYFVILLEFRCYIVINCDEAHVSSNTGAP
jgi:hypothetical protein